MFSYLTNKFYSSSSERDERPSDGEVAARRRNRRDVTGEHEALRAKRLEYVSNITRCRSCGSGEEDWCSWIDGLNIKQCKSCDEIHGLDDTMSEADLDEMIRGFHVHVCTCGNTDPYTYTIGEAAITCGQCHAQIPYTNTAGGEKMEGARGASGGTLDGLELTCSACQNSDLEKLSIFIDSDGDVVGMECQVCDKGVKVEEEEVQDEVKSGMMPNLSAGKKKRYYKERIKIVDVSELHEGDHLAWWRPEGYWHHALVERVYVESAEIHVIHYNGPSPRCQKIKGEVVEETLTTYEEKGHMYRFNYDKPKYDAHTAIIRARSRMGEKHYNLFTNNCEHFVRWCKTGVEQSVQVENVKSRLRDAAQFVNSHFSGKTAVTGMLWMTDKSVTREPIAKSVDKVIGMLPFLIKDSGVCKVVMFIGKQFFNDVNTAYKAYIAEDTSYKDFAYAVLQATARSLLTTTGSLLAPAAVAAAASALALPVPPTLIGRTLGYLLGEVTSHALSHAVTYHLEHTYS